MTTATMAPAEKKVWTVEDLLAFPDDGVQRWIIRGELREQPSEFPGATMIVRNRHHSEVMALITTRLTMWALSQDPPRGRVCCGEVGFILPDSTNSVGLDVAYIAPEVVAVQDDSGTTLVKGIPTLAVEILSPNDTVLAIEEKVDAYLDAGVPIVWVVNGYRQTIDILKPGVPPVQVSLTQRIPEDRHLPGFTPTVAELIDWNPVR